MPRSERKPYCHVELNDDGMSVRRDQNGDRYCCHLLIGSARVVLYWRGMPDIKPLTKVDLTPAAPNPPEFPEWAEP